MKVIFFEKPNCLGNAKQKKLLDMHFIPYETKNILTYPWEKKILNSFFDGVAKEDIYNPFAPKIKSKEIDAEKLSKDDLIELMLKDPILIKRPLLIIGDKKICGFNIEKINIAFDQDISGSISTCQSVNSSCD